MFGRSRKRRELEEQARISQAVESAVVSSQEQIQNEMSALGIHMLTQNSHEILDRNKASLTSVIEKYNEQEGKLTTSITVYVEYREKIRQARAAAIAALDVLNAPPVEREKARDRDALCIATDAGSDFNPGA